MKQYKLICEYPSSPKLGSIAIYGGNGNGYRIEGVGFFTLNTIENYPEYWQQIKEPLFVTEDNVNMYEGDEYYVCFPTQNKVYGKYKACSKRENWTCQYLNFAIRENAEKYIDYNKPKFSKKEIEEALNTSRQIFKNDYSVNSIEFKQKLGL